MNVICFCKNIFKNSKGKKITDITVSLPVQTIVKKATAVKWLPEGNPQFYEESFFRHEMTSIPGVMFFSLNKYSLPEPSNFEWELQVKYAKQALPRAVYTKYTSAFSTACEIVDNFTLTTLQALLLQVRTKHGICTHIFKEAGHNYVLTARHQTPVWLKDEDIAKLVRTGQYSVTLSLISSIQCRATERQTEDEVQFQENLKLLEDFDKNFEIKQRVRNLPPGNTEDEESTTASDTDYNADSET